MNLYTRLFILSFLIFIYIRGVLFTIISFYTQLILLYYILIILCAPSRNIIPTISNKKTYILIIIIIINIHTYNPPPPARCFLLIFSCVCSFWCLVRGCLLKIFYKYTLSTYCLGILVKANFYYHLVHTGSHFRSFTSGKYLLSIRRILFYLFSYQFTCIGLYYLLLDFLSYQMNILPI